eukprot:363264-Chlamydomonas_euryale.AAC.10
MHGHAAVWPCLALANMHAHTHGCAAACPLQPTLRIDMHEHRLASLAASFCRHDSQSRPSVSRKSLNTFFMRPAIATPAFSIHCHSPFSVASWEGSQRISLPLAQA